MKNKNSKTQRDLWVISHLLGFSVQREIKNRPLEALDYMAAYLELGISVVFAESEIIEKFGNKSILIDFTTKGLIKHEKLGNEDNFSITPLGLQYVYLKRNLEITKEMKEINKDMKYIALFALILSLLAIYVSIFS